MQNLRRRIKLELRCKTVHASNIYFLVHTALSWIANVEFTYIMIYYVLLACAASLSTISSTSTIIRCNYRRYSFSSVVKNATGSGERADGRSDFQGEARGSLRQSRHRSPRRACQRRSQDPIPGRLISSM